MARPGRSPGPAARQVPVQAADRPWPGAGRPADAGLDCHPEHQALPGHPARGPGRRPGRSRASGPVAYRGHPEARPAAAPCPDGLAEPGAVASRLAAAASRLAAAASRAARRAADPQALIARAARGRRKRPALQAPWRPESASHRSCASAAERAAPTAGGRAGRPTRARPRAAAWPAERVSDRRSGSAGPVPPTAGRWAWPGGPPGEWPAERRAWPAGRQARQAGPPCRETAACQA